MWILQGLLVLAVIIGGFVLLNKLNKIRAKKPYADYYAKKRREFPWLDKWINENVNPAELRASEGAETKTATSFALFIVFGGIGLVIVVFGGSLVIFFILSAIGLVIGELIGRRHLKDPSKLENEEAGLTLECPSCHCPHSWVLLEVENNVEREETTRETTTRSGYGQGDLMDSLLEGFKENGTTVKETTIYSGTSIRDFKCLNCGHTERNEYEWNWGNHYPESGTYNPPKAAWGVPGQAAELDTQTVLATGLRVEYVGIIADNATTVLKDLGFPFKRGDLYLKPASDAIQGVGVVANITGGMGIRILLDMTQASALYVAEEMTNEKLTALGDKAMTALKDLASMIASLTADKLDLTSDKTKTVLFTGSDIESPIEYGDVEAVIAPFLLGDNGEKGKIEVNVIGWE